MSDFNEQRYIVLRCSPCAMRAVREGHPGGVRMGDYLVTYEAFRIRVQLGCDACGSRMLRKVEDFTVQRRRPSYDHVLTLEEARVRAVEIRAAQEKRRIEFEKELERSYWEDYKRGWQKNEPNEPEPSLYDLVDEPEVY